MGTSGKEKKGTNACGGWEQGGGGCKAMFTELTCTKHSVCI